MSSSSTASMGSTAKESAFAYDLWADDYDTCENKTRDLDGEVLRAAMREKDMDLEGKAVVELGCGTGRHTHWIVATFGEHLDKYVAMDVSEASRKLH